MSTSPGSQVIIGITGTNGAGKGTIVEILVEQLGFKHYSARGYLTKILNEQGKELTRTNMSVLANGLRAANHPAILAQKLLEEAEKVGGNAVIESIRTPGEATLLRKHKNFQLLAVDADSHVRYNRVVVRGSSTDKIPYVRRTDASHALKSAASVPVLLERRSVEVALVCLVPVLSACERACASPAPCGAW